MVITFVGAWLFYAYQTGRVERDLLRTQYEQLRLELSQSDTNSAAKLFAPDYKGRIDHSFRLLRTFAKPLGSRSSVRIWNATASVTPERIWHYGFLPGGHSIELVRVDDQWLFTGTVHID